MWKCVTISMYISGNLGTRDVILMSKKEIVNKVRR